MGYKNAKSARDSYSLKLKKLGVERPSLKAKPAAKTTTKVSKSKPIKDSNPKKNRVRKPAEKKADEQGDGLEKVVEGA